MSQTMSHQRLATTARSTGFRRSTDQRRADFRRSRRMWNLWILVGVVWLLMTPLSSASAFSVSQAGFDKRLDRDGNGLEDDLDRWLAGEVSWSDLRRVATAKADAARLAATKDLGRPSVDPLPDAHGPWQAGFLRVICLGRSALELDDAVRAARSAGHCRVLHDVVHFGGVTVMSVDSEGLAALLQRRTGGRYLLDRDGVPALADSRFLVGGDQVAAGDWQLGRDWSGSIAILDSGCDTAHGDLGDDADDNVDGPPPAVGDAADWYAADSGWPLSDAYKVIGWQDVTDDFPDAAGPWDYHHHGTALASVAAGAGAVDEAYKGLAPRARLTIVKYYDFDDVWHAWAGDFIAACAWTLDKIETYRIRTVLMAVNWETDAGISDAISALLAAGVVPVAAMGNFGDDPVGPGFPAACTDVLTVGGVNAAGAVAAFSGRGGPVSAKPDLLAPSGGLLPEAGRIIAADNEPQDTYSGRVGTSLAAAHVAGTVLLVYDAMRQNGIPVQTDVTGARLIQAVLKATAARVDEAETSDGATTTLLPAATAPDSVRGWGLVRIDAAVDGLMRPLLPGQDLTDTLKTGWQEPVVARRLMTNADITYLVEAIPVAGLDVALDVIDPASVGDAGQGVGIDRTDANGPGVSEFTYTQGSASGWQLVVVKRVSGSGPVTLRLREADSVAHLGAGLDLPGTLTAPPNWGYLTDGGEPSLVVPSLVTIDPTGRAVNVVDTECASRPGWPVFIFPHVSALGGLEQPLVWNLDGVPGDEIVVSGDFGSVYFFTATGQFVRVELHFNRGLTAPVGVTTADGQNRVVVLDELGRLRAWSQGPTLEVDQELGHIDPLLPAAGQLLAAPGEELVVVFPDGEVVVLDADGAVLAGWPLTLDRTPVADPVLCDLDNDGYHEIYLPVEGAGGALEMCVLDGTGQTLPADGTILPTTEAGQWLQISSPSVVGSYETGDLRLALTGLQDNGLVGEDLSWSLGQLYLGPDGSTTVHSLPGFGLTAIVDQIILSLESALIAVPIGWDLMGCTGNEPVNLVSLHWRENLVGLTSLPGTCNALFQPSADGHPFSVRRPAGLGGSQATGADMIGTLVVPVAADELAFVQVVDKHMSVMPVLNRTSRIPSWNRARGDARNSGAYPLREGPSPSPTASVAMRVTAQPNPSNGVCRFRFAGVDAGLATHLSVYDLRGRLVRRWTAAPTETPVWDGRDRSGRQVATGAYLVRASRGRETATTRVVITR